MIIEDAKAYFASVPQKYDLIISEPSNPWMGGTASLFSTEFYEYVLRQLNRAGPFVPWLQLYEITTELVNSVLSALLADFSDAPIYLADGGDLILVPSPHGKVLDLGDGMFRQPLLAKDLARIGVRDLRDLQHTLVLNRRGMEGFPELYPYRVNLDMYPVLQLQAPHAKFEQEQVSDFHELGAAPWPLVRYLGRPAARSGVETDSNRMALGAVQSERRASELFAALLEGRGTPPQAMSEQEALQVDALRGLAASCQLGQQPLRDTKLILSMASKTTAYLDPARLRRMWGNPVWLHCPASEPTVDTARALAAAVAEDRTPNTGLPCCRTARWRCT